MHHPTCMRSALHGSSKVSCGNMESYPSMLDTAGSAVQASISIEEVGSGRSLLKVSHPDGSAICSADVPSAAVWQAQPRIFFVQVEIMRIARLIGICVRTRAP